VGSRGVSVAIICASPSSISMWGLCSPDISKILVGLLGRW
jgi:hypothetical protein